MTARKLYLALPAACAAGYGWLYWNLPKAGEGSGVCIIKRISGWPCPSCGTTRAVLLLFQGHFREAMLMNPFGLVIAGVLVVAPLWLVYDLLFKKKTLWQAYLSAEAFIRRPVPATILVLLVLLNWIWNIKKEV